MLGRSWRLRLYRWTLRIGGQARAYYETRSPRNAVNGMPKRFVRESVLATEDTDVPNTTLSTIIAVFRNSSDAQAAARDLEAAGISQNDIYFETESTGTTSRSKKKSDEGGITGWFKSVFGDESDGERSGYENAVRQGNALLRVDVSESEVSTVETILNRYSPIDLHEDTGERSGVTGGQADTTKAIPVVEEEIQVGKRQVLRGGVRVYSRVVEEPVEETIGLREESVRVERRPVNRPATDADVKAGREQVIEVQEFAEEPVVAKQARVVEEVVVGKEVSERKETIRDTVRRTEVDVKETSGRTGTAFDDSAFRADFQQRYAGSGASYDTYLPAYEYGYEMASDPRYKGRSFDEVESDLRSDYGRRNPNSTWEKMKDSIRYGWNKVTGKA